MTVFLIIALVLCGVALALDFLVAVIGREGERVLALINLVAVLAAIVGLSLGLAA